ncbi:carboxypeptidase-like regulatory domain-containing protein [uncultured Bacteroides sp.]|uniref:carboxypeptidase-like regulatory domain-containing protein n=1 Tax=uncultured Bacteroides sp. TaxID=162156 RepID=UPI00280AC33D|nr:carboxypeptidase-like regulatory domain-containing protein [uncultured Bacteroides sp.]
MMKTKRGLLRMPLFKCFVGCFLVGSVPVASVYGATLNMEVNQRQNVEGVVLDVNGEPIIGATVQRIGQTGGTITDENGKFSLSFSDNVKRVKLRISYIGMETQEVFAHVNSPLKVVMEEDVNTLSDVVVIGYGTEKKKNVAGAVSNII